MKQQVDLSNGIMLIEDDIGLEKVVKSIILDLKSKEIKNFQEWLIHYDETIDEVVEFVDDYCTKVTDNKIDEIEQWQKVIMLNAVALYMIEWDTEQIPNGMMNRILQIYVETIRYYSMFKKGYLKLSGTILISDISLFRFTKIDEE